MASRYRWRQQLLGSLQGQLQLATYLVGFLGFTGALSVGLLIGQRQRLNMSRSTHPGLYIPERPSPKGISSHHHH